MKEWTTKKKIALAAAFVVLVAAVAVFAGVMNRRTTQTGEKAFQVEVTSERDSYYAMDQCQSEEETLGAFLRSYEECQWEERDYGIYITGFHGYAEDMDNQYWWCIMVNGESAVTGADEIPLKEGDTYSFLLKKGW